MGVHECTRTVGGVHIPHAVCVHGVRTPPTLRVHSRTLPTVSLHLRTLTHDWGQTDAMATLTARPDGMPTRRDGQRRCVYTKV